MTAKLAIKRIGMKFVRALILENSLLHKHAGAFCKAVFGVRVVSFFEAVAKQAGKKVVSYGFPGAHKGIYNMIG